MKKLWFLVACGLCGVWSALPAPLLADEGSNRGKGDGEREVRKEGKDNEERRPAQPRREGEAREEREGRPEQRPEGRPDQRPGEGDRREPRPPGPPEGRPGDREGDFRGPPRDGRPGERPPGPPRDGRPGEPPHPPQHDLERLKEHDPEMYELMQKDMQLERAAFELMNQIRQGSNQDREKQKDAVKELVTKHFAVRQDRRKLQLKRLENELTKLKESVEVREKQREEIINRRVSEMLGQESDLGF